jgi:putative phosphoribosyl transferase
MFASRASAGRHLAAALKHHANEGAFVLGLPNGGVPVASQVSGPLVADIDVLIVRTTRVGLYVEGCRPLIELPRTIKYGMSAADVSKEIEHEKRELEREIALFRGNRPFPSVADRTTIVVDDGSATTRALAAALSSLRARGARTVLAVPVLDPAARKPLSVYADEIVALEEAEQRGVDYVYRDPSPVADRDVIVELNRARVACWNSRPTLPEIKRELTGT